MGDAGKPILCIGALTLDTIFHMPRLPPGPGKFLPEGAVVVAAGMATSAATAIARLGGSAALWASIGDDANGKRLVAEIIAEGVDCDPVRCVPGARSAFAAILVDAAGERIIVPQYDPALLTRPDTHPAIAEVAYAAVMTDVRWPSAAEIALATARAAGVPAILDADVAPAAILERLLPLASHVVASEPAAMASSGRDTPEAAMRALAERLGVFVAVTAGGRGVYWSDPESGRGGHIAAPKATIRDTLAAGDVFHGAFALGLVEGMSLPDALTFAAMAAAIKCETFGGRLGAPDRATVTARMALAR